MLTNLMCFFITPHCRDVLKELLVLDGHVVKDKFINAYVEVVNSHQLLRYTCVALVYSLKYFFF